MSGVRLQRALRIVLVAIVPMLLAMTPQEQVLTPEQDARYRSLIHELRCLVCQNQTIADSNADLAKDLRDQVHGQIAAGASDADIRRYVTERYGDFVLYKPPLSARTVVLWAGPFLMLAGALLIALRMLRRRPASGPAAADTARLSRILDEET